MGTDALTVGKARKSKIIFSFIGGASHHLISAYRVEVTLHSNSATIVGFRSMPKYSSVIDAGYPPPILRSGSVPPKLPGQAEEIIPSKE